MVDNLLLNLDMHNKLTNGVEVEESQNSESVSFTSGERISMVGFKMSDAFAELQGIPVDTVHCKALFGKGFVDGVSVFLAKPQTYMNLSGESISNLKLYFKRFYFLHIVITFS